MIFFILVKAKCRVSKKVLKTGIKSPQLPRQTCTDTRVPRLKSIHYNSDGRQRHLSRLFLYCSLLDLMRSDEMLLLLAGNEGRKEERKGGREEGEG